jgi:demethylmenaquinone methyltransferase/2-methoxy-6-polyprenyl-1,4-benzoquinol methylase
VLRPGGRIVVLEFSKPRAFPIKQVYEFYGRRILPVVGRLVSGDPAAYTYLPESIRAFPDGDAFLSVLEAAGFTGTRSISLTFGIASIYTGLAS